MSRRRPADGPIPDDEESQIPVVAHLSEAGKSRTPCERIVRFARQRPITSLLAVILVCALGFICLAATQAAIAIFYSRSATHDVIIRATGPGDANIVDTVTEHDPPPSLHKIDNDRSAQDPQAADASKGDAKPAIAEDTAADAADLAPPAPKCLIKYSAGKLGSGAPLCVTDEYFFDISSGSTSLGTMRIGVFGEVVPKSAANFRALVTCTGAFSDTALCFRGDSFHRIVRNFVVQGGSKATGKSIYGGTFREELEKDHHSFLEHGERGVLAWAEYPIGSQFYILLSNEAKYLDKNHVVFGIVTAGLDVVEQIAKVPLVGERPSEPVTITNCGEVKQ